MPDLSVAEVASQLRLDPSRVRQLLRAGALPGQRVGRDWVVPSSAVVLAANRPARAAGRPPAPRRAWALLALLDGGRADWLDTVARSHVRAQVRALAGKDAEAWAKALRGREDRLAVAGHRSAVSRLLGASNVWPAGPAVANKIGADLVVVDVVPEVYCSAENWKRLSASLHLRAADEADVWVRIPRQVWPFGPEGPGPASLAASLLDGEWRAARAGAEVLNKLAGGAVR